MRLILMRHGDAEERAASDFERPLSTSGIREVHDTCVKLEKQSMSVARLITSPLVRAQQTAAIVNEKVTRGLPVDTWPEVSPSGSPKEVALLLEASEVTETFIVTHQPFISDFIAYLTGETVPMRTAMVVCIESKTLAFEFGEIQWILS